MLCVCTRVYVCMCSSKKWNSRTLYEIRDDVKKLADKSKSSSDNLTKDGHSNLLQSPEDTDDLITILFLVYYNCTMYESPSPQEVI